MEILALIIALVALLMAAVALRRTGGIEDLQRKVQGLAPNAEGFRGRTADALDRLSHRIRRREPGEPEPPAQPEAPPGEVKSPQDPA